jgi:hypothetical protein
LTFALPHVILFLESEVSVMLKDYAKGVIGVDDHKFNKAYDFLTKYGYRFSTYSRARGYRERMKYSIVAEKRRLAARPTVFQGKPSSERPKSL